MGCEEDMLLSVNLGNYCHLTWPAEAGNHSSPLDSIGSRLGALDKTNRNSHILSVNAWIVGCTENDIRKWKSG